VSLGMMAFLRLRVQFEGDGGCVATLFIHLAMVMRIWVFHCSVAVMCHCLSL